MEPIVCLYCNAPWKNPGFDHADDCYIRTGVYRVLGRKKRAPPEPVEPLVNQDDDPGPEAA